MRIAIDVRATQTAHRERGIGRSVFDLVRALAEHGGGHEFGLLVQESVPLPSALSSLPPNFSLLPVDGPLLNGTERSWVMHVPRLRSRPLGRRLNDRIMRRRHGQGFERAVRRFAPDVLHFAAPIDLFTDCEGQFECRTVATFFDAIPRIDPASHYDPLPEVMREHYDRQFARLARFDAIVAISNSSREEALRYAKTAPERTFTVHLALGDDFTEPANRDVSAFILGKPYFLFLSSLDAHKNPEGVVKAFAQSGADGYRLIMVSSKKSLLFGAISALIEQLGLSDRVTITDFVDDERLRALVQGATALVSPSFQEGFGLPAGQAMRAGIPVIASNRTSQPEVVGDAGILLDPSDIDALAAAMKSLVDAPELRSELSRRGKARSALFNYERLARNMIDVYEVRSPSDPIPGL